MEIREAKLSDKNSVLEFCKNTFSWGDYVQDVWDYWVEEGNLFVIEKENPLGICHGFFSTNRVWIEGIRIESSARRQGLASKLVTHVERVAIKKGINSSLMLIDTENFPSICMAKNLGYSISETWKFYSLIPDSAANYDVKFGHISETNLLLHYVKSWRWLELDSMTIRSLSNNKKIIHCDKESNPSLAILTDSEHFDKTLIVTLHAGSETNTTHLISYLQNFGFTNNYVRIQILTKEFLPNFGNLEYRISFHLMTKSLD
ncbi:MAG: GNAT family N-acetyltransferase [Candidatus Nitrosomaritimum yanchengensis]